MSPVRAIVAATLLGLSGASQAALVSYDSDSAFTNPVTGAQFTKAFGANVRWGNNAGNGDWEYAVVNASDAPFAGAQGSYQWTTPGTGYPNQGYDFDYDAVSGQVTLRLRNGLAGAIGAVSADVTPGAVPAPEVNTLVVRARAAGNDVATMDAFRVNFGGIYTGQFVDIPTLVGDGDAQYWMLVDARLAAGFTVTDFAILQDGSGSLPMWQFKVGVTPIPEPTSVALLGAGLALLGYGAARRRS